MTFKMSLNICQFVIRPFILPNLLFSAFALFWMLDLASFPSVFLPHSRVSVVTSITFNFFHHFLFLFKKLSTHKASIEQTTLLPRRAYQATHVEIKLRLRKQAMRSLKSKKKFPTRRKICVCNIRYNIG